MINEEDYETYVQQFVHRPKVDFVIFLLLNMRFTSSDRKEILL